jgi:tRNA(His) guanylyltransferase
MRDDSLGNRMKEFYENRTRYKLTRKNFQILRVDGKAFHTYTKGFSRPFDVRLVGAMNNTAIKLLEEIQGSLLAYIQSDEISVLFSDKTRLDSELWFDGNIQKISSISASIASTRFNQVIDDRDKPPALFDARVFSIPEIYEVINYFIWRQEDAIRNSIQMVGQANFSHDQLKGKNGKDVIKMLHEIDKNYYDYSSHFRMGRFVYRRPLEREDIDEIKNKYGHYFIKNEFKMRQRYKIEVLEDTWNLRSKEDRDTLIDYINARINLPNK